MPTLPSSSQKIIPTTQPAKTQLSPEEKKQRFAELRERLGKSRIQAVPPPGSNLVGYWARKDDPGELSRLEYFGYVIVHDDPKAPKWKASGLKEDGTYVLGDVILMSIDQDIYDFLQERNQEQSQALMAGAKENFKQEAMKSDVPVFERTK